MSLFQKKKKKSFMSIFLCRVATDFELPYPSRVAPRPSEAITILHRSSPFRLILADATVDDDGGLPLGKLGGEESVPW
jgi:hypothetical protein